MNTAPIVYVGVDVAKASLRFDAGDGYSKNVENQPAAIKRELARLRKRVPAGSALQVCFEATGCYTRKLKHACVEAGVAASTLNAYKVKQYARAMSVSAKTDLIDARMIRLYSEHRKPGPDAPMTEGQEEMKELAGLRALYQKQEGMLRGALESAGAACAVKSVKASLASVERQISRLEARLEELRDADAKRAAVCAELTKIAGVGDLTALLVTSLVPELGTLSRRRSASLAGLAPHPEDSGTIHAPRHIKGGRFHVRRTLYMAALSASQFNAVLKVVYERKIKEGKPFKVAIVCIMRKLFVHMDRVAAKVLKDLAATPPLATA